MRVSADRRFRNRLAESERKAWAVIDQLKSITVADVTDRICSILETRGLTLSRVSRQSSLLYGGSSHYFVPHSLYRDLRLGTFTPSLQQVCALSRITEYQLEDWLLVFGFDLESIPRLQAMLPSKRTIILDTTLNNPNSWTRWFKTRHSPALGGAVAPLKQLVDFYGHKRVRDGLDRNMDGDLLHVKVGYEDTLGFPEVLPGSIMAVRSQLGLDSAGIAIGTTSEKLFLVEHSKGFCCCRVHFSAKDRLVLVSSQLPYAQVELRVPGEARLRGVLDEEFRFLAAVKEPSIPKELANLWRPESITRERANLGLLLRASRKRMGLSFREASAKTIEIAKMLGDQRYFAAPGSLSDYEALNTAPRHIHKIISLCVLYGVPFSAFLTNAAPTVDESPQHSIPDNLIPRMSPSISGEYEWNSGIVEGVDSENLLVSLHEPFFHQGTLESLSGVAKLGANDFFWIGGTAGDLSPHLKNGIFAIVNRHRKKPVFSRSKALWQQSLYMLLKRDGTYVCACCSLENEMLVIHPCSGEFQPPKRLRNRQDAEVLGQIVMVARRIP